MKQHFKFAILIFVFFLPFQQTSASGELNVEECTVDSVQFAQLKGNHDRYRFLFSGKCNDYYPFSLGSYYSISGHMYREVIKVSNFGYSYLLGWCQENPVLSEKPCAWLSGTDTTNAIHAKYKSSIARDLLTEEQLAELESQMALAMKRGLAEQPRAKTLRISKTEALAHIPKSAAPPPFTTWEAIGVDFNVQSPVDGESYPVAPILKLVVPERVDVQYHVNKCKLPMRSAQCEQFETTIPASDLQCNEEADRCRFEGGFNPPMTASMHYIVIVRPLPLHYDPIIIEFDFASIAEATDLRKRMKVKQ